MPTATDQQVQVFVDDRLRPFAEKARELYLLAEDHLAAIGDVYDHVNGSPTWSDDRSDGPPHLAQPSDVLAVNTFMTMFKAFIEGTLTDGDKNTGAAQWPVVLDLCVRAPSA